MRLLDKLRSGSRDVTSVEAYVAAMNQFSYAGNNYPLNGYGAQQTMNGSYVETVQHSFQGYANAMHSNGIVFACMLARQQVFSSTRFQWQRMRDGRPSDMFGTPALGLLEEPWVGGTTQDLLSRMIQDADLAGNSYWVHEGGELVRLRPDWVSLVLQKNPATGTYRKLANLFSEDGVQKAEDARLFWPEDVAHFAPIPDPMANFRGMSWITPVVREVQVDGQMTKHKSRYFENAATPNMVISFKEMMSEDQFRKFVAAIEHKHAGVSNAYKTLVLGGGADATVVGSDFKQLDLRAVQGAGETRIAAAAGVPPIIVGLSEGLEAATYSNYGQARRRYADGTIHPLWQNAAGTFQTIVRPPGSDVRLWYDSRDVPFLREDEKDAAQITFTQAQTMRQWIDAGYTADSVKAAMLADDIGLLEHSGMFSVQLQAPGSREPSTPTDEVS